MKKYSVNIMQKWATIWNSNENIRQLQINIYLGYTYTYT